MNILDSLVEGALRLSNRREGDELIGMMVRYLATGEEPEPRTDAQQAVIVCCMPVLEKSRKRAASGSKGGSSKSEANDEANAQANAQANGLANEVANREANGQANKELGIRNKELGEKEGAAHAPTRPRKRFEPPTVEEVQGRIDEKGYGVSAERFVSYYESNGWRVGRNPMRDWRAALASWESRDRKEAGDARSEELEDACGWLQGA